MNKIKVFNSTIFVIFFLFSLSPEVFTQTIKDGKLLIDESGDHYLKLSFVSQFWVRSGKYNPGSAIFGYSKERGTDIGIRRFRLQLFGQLTNKIFFYSQFGENNFNNISDRKPSFFVHDIYSEYAFHKTKLSIGAGLSGWSGLARFASPSVANIMGLDAPLFQQATNDVTDQFLRKLGVFAKGKLGRFDYRILVAEPLAFQKSPLYSSEVTKNSNFSSKPPNVQWNGYFQYQFKDIEANTTPYMIGTYHGKRSVLNIGAGIEYQKNSLWHLSDNGKDTIQSDLLMYAVDLFYDAPVGKNGEALNIYANASHLDYGPGYIRNLGVMNPTNGSNNNHVINGGGFGFPAYGTGNVLYLQVGYKLKDNLIGSSTLMPYFSVENAKYNRFSNDMNFISTGLNVLLNGHKSKLTIAYENRPVFFTDSEAVKRLGSWILQYQISY